MVLLLVVLVVGVAGVLGLVAALAIAPMQVYTVRSFIIRILTVGHATTTTLNYLRLVEVHSDIIRLTTIVKVLINSLLMHRREKATLILVLMECSMFG